jgi:hypothetical protein
MSQFFDNLRSRLSGRFNPATRSLADAKGVTLVLYLPGEDAAIETAFQVACLRRVSSASARRLDDADDLKRSGGLPWRLTMAFYLIEDERTAFESRIAGIAESMGGRIETWVAEPDLINSGRQAA